MLAGMFGAELKVKQIVVPYTASVNCAFGLVSADIAHEYSTVQVLPATGSVAAVNDIFRPLAEQALRQLAADGFAGDKVRLDCSIDLRYSRQVHEVNTPVRATLPLDEAALAQVVADFETLYERKYGKGSAYREAGMEMTQFRLTARGLMQRPELAPLPLGGTDSSAALAGRRKVFVEAAGGMAEAPIYDFEKLHPGNIIVGPAVIHTPITTIVLQSRQQGRMDGYRNILVDFV